MAEIAYRTQNSFMTPDNSTNQNNKFVTRDGLEFVLHEFESGDSSASICGISSRDFYAKKRGRPKKNENENENESHDNSRIIASSFETSPHSEAKKRRMERKMEKIMLRKSLKEKLIEEKNLKKRGRPRKLIDDVNCQSETDQPNTTSEQVFDLERFVEPDFSSLNCSNSSSGYDTRSSFNEVPEITQMLNFQRESNEMPTFNPNGIE